MCITSYALRLFVRGIIGYPQISTHVGIYLEQFNYVRQLAQKLGILMAWVRPRQTYEVSELNGRNGSSADA